MTEAQRMRVMPVVKAYPEPSQKYGTTVCVAAVTIPEGRWVRLYPIKYTRELKDRLFKKYQIFEADAQKDERDPRPESYRIDEDSIEFVGRPVGTGDGWSERKRLLEKAPVGSFCELRRLQKIEGKSLGMVSVRSVTNFDTVEADEEKYEESERRYDYAAAADLFDDTKLEVAPLRFKYRYHFRCMDPTCKSHKCSIIDWEAYELHRKMVGKWGGATAFDKVKQKYVDEICGPEKETYFFMGNMRTHPGSFLVLGAFYPPRSDSPTFWEFPEMDPTARTEVPPKPSAEQDTSLFETKG